GGNTWGGFFEQKFFPKRFLGNRSKSFPPQRGSGFWGVLSNFSRTVKYSGSSYPFPTTSETPRVVYNSRTDKPWPVALYLTPVSIAGGGAIKAGPLIAVLILGRPKNYNACPFYHLPAHRTSRKPVIP
ncbi:fimbrial protein, partial [Escherichia coli]|nr:fimbrial protein [Escherichia coli]